MIDLLRRLRFALRPEPPRHQSDDHHFQELVDWLSDKYGNELGLWLAKRFAHEIRRVDDPCMSHFRVCDHSRWREVVDYEKIRDDGCCGFSDTELHHYKSGRKFWIGFNYGH